MDPPPLKAFVINLPHRKDRLDTLKEKFKGWNLDMEVVPGIKHKEAWIGCTLSHRRVIEIAKERNLPWVLVLEDDCMPADPTPERFNRLLPSLWNRRQDWDMFNGAPNGVTKETTTVIQKDPPLFQVKGLTAHFIIVNSIVYDKILNALPPDNLPMIADLYYKDNVRMWATVPYLAYQTPSFSNIQNEYKNYKTEFIKPETLLKEMLQEQKGGSRRAHTRNQFHDGKKYKSKEMPKRRMRKNRTVRRRRTRMRGGNERVPIFIIAWNQYTFIKSMVEQLSNFPNLEIYIIDNKSTYQPLIDYLKSIDGKNGIKVLYQDKNYGHTVYEQQHMLSFIDSLGVKKYVVTDPDLGLNPKLPMDFLQTLAKLSDTYKVNRIGFALDISTNDINLDMRLDSPTGITFKEFEAPYWKDKIPDPNYELYRAPIDTTFVLINKDYRELGNLGNSIRIAGNFTATHKPWLKNWEKELRPDELEMFLNPKENVSTSLLRYKKKNA